MVPPTHAAWHSRDILPILRFAEAWDAGSTSETYGPETLPDRRSVGIESETTQTGVDWAPRDSALVGRGSRSRVGRIRPIPASSVACALAGYDTLHANCRTKNISSARQFQRRVLPLATAARIYRSSGVGGGGWNVPTAAGSMTRETELLLFNSVRANVSTIYRISFACTQGRIETE
jgi:hypothetical protein